MKGCQSFSYLQEVFKQSEYESTARYMYCKYFPFCLQLAYSLDAQKVLILMKSNLFSFSQFLHTQSHGDSLTLMSRILLKIIFLKLVSVFPYDFSFDLPLYIDETISNQLRCNSTLKKIKRLLYFIKAFSTGPNHVVIFFQVFPALLRDN